MLYKLRRSYLFVVDFNIRCIFRSVRCVLINNTSLNSLKLTAMQLHWWLFTYCPSRTFRNANNRTFNCFIYLIHEEDLMADWKLAVKGEAIFKIDPIK